MEKQIRIQPLNLSRKQDVLRFLKLSYKIYQNDPNWVAPLLVDAVKIFSNKNPLFEHCQMQLWIAESNGNELGRIAGIIDETHQKIHQDGAAFFGFYECVNDAATSARLFETITEWAKQNGAKRLLGPMNPTTNDECGLLVQGFDSPPVFMMTYNPPYYINQIENAGFTKARDLLAYFVDVQKCPLERLSRLAERVKQRHPELTFRPVKRNTLNNDLAKIKKVYNQAWEKNWGFVPMTEAEMDFMASRLKPLFCEGLVWLAEANNEPVGFLLALPDYNQTFIKLRGRLLTPRTIGCLPYLLKWKYPDGCRVITLGVIEKYRNKGLEAAMLNEGFKVGIRLGIKKAEASWILEDNLPMCRVMEYFGGVVYKRYRIYQKEL
ncbi:MAG: GNAT family N-acetyltransferase [Verrucomicrobiia bacterium]